MNRFAPSLALVPCLFASIVATAATNPDSQANQPPPRLVEQGNNLSWDNASAFGPVPAELQAMGDGWCRSIGLETATGYNADALDASGRVLEGGGYSCSGRVNPEADPGARPPRMVRGSTGLYWDNPRAFGGVPTSLQATGDDICRSLGFEQANGYHPKALDVNGRPIDGGGYFCASRAL